MPSVACTVTAGSVGGMTCCQRMRHTGALPFPADLRGHEFHYSRLASQGSGEPLFEAADAAGRDLPPAGLRAGRIMGSYLHVIDGADQ